MKKYYFTESGNEVKFGDQIQLDFTQELENGRIQHKHLDCKFFPGIVKYLLEEGIIEEREEKEKEVHGETTSASISEDEEEDIMSFFDSFYALEEKVNHIEHELSLVKELGKKYACQMDTLLDILQKQIAPKKK